MIRSRHIFCLAAVVALLVPPATSLAVQVHHALADHHAELAVHGHSHSDGADHAHPPTVAHAPMPVLPLQVGDRHDHAGPPTLPGLVGERSTYRPQLERRAELDVALDGTVVVRPSALCAIFDADSDPPLPTTSSRLHDQRILLLI